METGFLEESVSNYKGSTHYFRSLDAHSYRNLIQNIVGPLLLYLCHTPGVAVPHSAPVRSEPRPPPPGTRATCVLLQFGNHNVVCVNQFLGVHVIAA